MLDNWRKNNNKGWKNAEIGPIDFFFNIVSFNNVWLFYFAHLAILLVLPSRWCVCVCVGVGVCVCVCVYLRVDY